MSRSVDVFESTLQKTYDWLNDLMQILYWDDRQKAYLAIKGTLQALRDRLPVEISAKLSAQLPMLVRGFYYEGWKPSITPVKVKSTQEFLDFVSTYFANSPLSQEPDIGRIVRAVFLVIANHISAGEVHHIRQALPLPIAELWPSLEYARDREVSRREYKEATRYSPNLDQ